MLLLRQCGLECLVWLRNHRNSQEMGYRTETFKTPLQPKALQQQMHSTLKEMKQKPTLITRKREYRIAQDLESYRIPRNSRKETTDKRRMKSLLRKVMVLFLITTYQFFCLGKLDNLWVYGYLNAGKTTHTQKEIYGGIWKLRVGR